MPIALIYVEFVAVVVEETDFEMREITLTGSAEEPVNQHCSRQSWFKAEGTAMLAQGQAAGRDSIWTVPTTTEYQTMLFF